MAAFALTTHGRFGDHLRVKSRTNRFGLTTGRLLSQIRTYKGARSMGKSLWVWLWNDNHISIRLNTL
jgi:hypothetical protein